MYIHACIYTHTTHLYYSQITVVCGSCHYNSQLLQPHLVSGRNTAPSQPMDDIIIIFTVIINGNSTIINIIMIIKNVNYI